MNEVKIQIPDNCELIKDGNIYIVKERKQTLPRSWEEFCKKYPRTTNEYYIADSSELVQVCNSIFPRDTESDKNVCTSKEEAEAFLALMQLRQLRKAWVGDWDPVEDSIYWGVYKHITIGVTVTRFSTWTHALTFPTEEMAKDFLSCFRDLCETAKILL